eukprot:scaffold149_cov315-Pinguiococcus_pyrenoidosus.AAC.15
MAGYQRLWLDHDETEAGISHAFADCIRTDLSASLGLNKISEDSLPPVPRPVSSLEDGPRQNDASFPGGRTAVLGLPSL